MNIFSASILSLVGLLFSTSGVNGHAIEVRSCINTAGDLRIFVEHWHNDLATTAAAGTLDITNVVTGVQNTLLPTGIVNNINLDAGGVLPGCASTTLVDTCTPYSGPMNNWVYYDFPFACQSAVTYSLDKGNTMVLMEGCDNLYPAIINPYNDCANAPSAAPSDPVPSVHPSLAPSAAPVTPPLTAAPTATPTTATPTATPCTDTDGKFTVGTGKEKGCAWLAEKTSRQLRHCGTAEVQSTCPSTCCDCGTCPTSRPTSAPTTAAPTTAAPTAAPTSSPSMGGKGKGGKGKTRVLRGLNQR